MPSFSLRNIHLHVIYCQGKNTFGICFENKEIIFSFCSNRHTVCSECFRKIRNIEDIEKPCPFCRCQLKVFVPCKYEKHGCSAFSFASKISQHESNCTKKCPYTFCCFRPSWNISHTMDSQDYMDQQKATKNFLDYISFLVLVMCSYVMSVVREISR